MPGNRTDEAPSACWSVAPFAHRLQCWPRQAGAAGSGSDTPAETASATGPAQSTDPDLAARPANDRREDSPARLDGFAGAKLGAGIAEVRAGFGTPLQGLGTDAAGKPLPADDSNDGCYFLRPQDAEDPRLMIEGRKLVRYDVRSAAITAPGVARSA